MLLANQFAIQMCRELGLPLVSRALANERPRRCSATAGRGIFANWKNVVERSVYRHGDSEHELDAIIINPFRQSPGSPPEAAPGDELPALPLDLRAISSSSRRKTPAAAESGAGEVSSEAGGGAAGIILYHQPALLKSISCERRAAAAARSHRHRPQT